MKAIKTRLNQIESQLPGRTAQQGFTIIFDEHTVRVGGQVMTFAEYEQLNRPVAPGVQGIDFREYNV